MKELPVAVYAECKAILIEHEADRRELYDDETGKRLIQGSTIKGHPTIGIGHNLDAAPISAAAVDQIFKDDLQSTIAMMDGFIPWYRTRKPTIIAAVVSWAFNMGAAGFRKCAPTLKLMESGDYAAAAVRIRRFKAARSPLAGLRKRYEQIASIIESGG